MGRERERDDVTSYVVADIGESKGVLFLLYPLSKRALSSVSPVLELSAIIKRGRIAVVTSMGRPTP